MHFGSYLYHIVPIHYAFPGHSTRFKVFWAGIALNSCRFSCIMPLRGMLQSGLTCAQRAREHSVNEIHFLKHQNAQFRDICDGHWIHLMDFGGCIMPNTSSLSRPQMIWFDYSSLIHIIGMLMHNAHSNDLTVIPKNGSIQFCDRLRLPFRNDWRYFAFWDYGSAAHPISTTRALILITWVELLDESKVHDSTADEHYVILMHHSKLLDACILLLRSVYGAQRWD